MSGEVVWVAGVAPCLAVYGCLAGMETALRNLNRLRLHHLSRAGLPRAQALEAFLRPPCRVQGAVRMAGGLARGVVLAGVAGTFAVGRAPFGWGLLLAFVVLGEALPRTWFSWRPIDRLGLCLPLLRGVERLGRPFTAGGCGRCVPPPEAHAYEAPEITREVLDGLLLDGAASGAFSATEHRMMSRVLALQSRRVCDVMVPETRIVSIAAEASLAAFFAHSREHGFLRMPVRDGAAGPYVGILNVLSVAGQDAPERTTVRDVMRAPLFVRPELSVVELLPLLRRNRQPMALVRDSEGRVLGLMTLGDVVDAVVGPVADPAS